MAPPLNRFARSKVRVCVKDGFMEVHPARKDPSARSTNSHRQINIPPIFLKHRFGVELPNFLTADISSYTVYSQ